MSDTPPTQLAASSDNPPRADDGNERGEGEKPASKPGPAPRSKARDKGKSDEAKRKATPALGRRDWHRRRSAFADWRGVLLVDEPQSRKHRRRLHRRPRDDDRAAGFGHRRSLDVTDNQFVKKDQPLIHIDPRQYITDRDQAAGRAGDRQGAIAGQQFGAEIARKNFPAQLEQAQAQLANAQGQPCQDRRPTTSASAACRKQATTPAGRRCRDGRAEAGAGAGRARRSAGHAELAGAAAHRRGGRSRSGS